MLGGDAFYGYISGEMHLTFFPFLHIYSMRLALQSPEVKDLA